MDSIELALIPDSYRWQVRHGDVRHPVVLSALVAELSELGEVEIGEGLVYVTVPYNRVSDVGERLVELALRISCRIVEVSTQTTIRNTSDLMRAIETTVVDDNALVCANRILEDLRQEFSGLVSAGLIREGASGVHGHEWWTIDGPWKAGIAVQIDGTGLWVQLIAHALPVDVWKNIQSASVWLRAESRDPRPSHPLWMLPAADSAGVHWEDQWDLEGRRVGEIHALVHKNAREWLTFIGLDTQRTLDRLNRER